MRRKAFHRGDGSHKCYETREEFEQRRQAEERAKWAEAIVEENAPDDSDDVPGDARVRSTAERARAYVSFDRKWSGTARI